MTQSDAEIGGSADAALAAALATGATHEAAAASSNVSRRTVSRRLADPGFRSLLDELRRDALARVADRLASSALTALDTLTELLTEESPPTIRLGAARAVLSEASRYHEAAQLTARVDALEAALQARPRSA